MAPKRKSRQLSAVYEVSPIKGGTKLKTSMQRKGKLSDMLGSQWNKEEFERFYKAFRKHGKNWKKVSAAVRKRSADMVEALYTMNRKYLSLPEGSASVVGLIAMMTDRYCNPAYVADSPDIPPPRRKGRGATRLKSLTINRNGDGHERLSIEFDQNGLPVGPKASEFISYVAVQARLRASILHATWDQVEEEVKNQIWDDITLTYDVPNTKEIKKQWIKYSGERWRAFKTRLAKEYIYNKTDKTPFAKYEFIDPQDWEKFVAIRQDPAFQEKRKKAQEIQAKNVYPHRLSRGGYRKLTEMMIEEQKKQFQEQSSQDGSTCLVVFEPQPIKRHIKWKRARLRPSGEFTSEPSRAIAETIDSLERESSQGTFLPSGRQDILATALGKPDHPGRVVGVGWGVGIRQYHGSSSHHNHGEDIETLKARITSEIRGQLQSELRDQLRDELKSELRNQLESELRDQLESELRDGLMREMQDSSVGQNWKLT